MDATFRLVANFKGIIDIISNMSDTVTFRYTSDGIAIQSIDSSHISMLYLNLKLDQFLNYEVDSPGVVSFNITSFKPILKSIKDQDHLRIKYKKDSDQLDVYLIDADRQNKYKIKLMDIDTEFIDMSVDMEHEVFIATGKMALTKILNDIKNLDSDETRFIVSGTDLALEVKSSLCDLKMKPAAELMKVLIPKEETVSIQFASKYILHIQRMLAIAKPRINLRLDRECPLLLEFTIRTDQETEKATNKSYSTLKYYLAPKIDA